MVTLIGLVALGTCAHGQEALTSQEVWRNNYQRIHAEQLVERGILAMQQGEFQSAEQDFSEAIQVVKVNNGLHSRLQVPALSHLIESLFAQGRWETADQQLAYFEWLNIRSYSKNIFDYLEGSRELSRLYLQASAYYTNPQSARYLISAKNLNWRVVRSIEVTFGTDHPLLTPWLYDIVLIHFYQASLVKRRGMTSYEFKSDDDKIIAGWALGKNESIQLSYSIGNELLQRIRSLYAGRENASAVTDALMQVYLGDWELLFDNTRMAMSYYRDAYAELNNAGVVKSEIDLFFSQSIVLPAGELAIDWQPEKEHALDGTARFIAWSTNYPGAAIPVFHNPTNGSLTPEFKVLASFSLLAVNSTEPITDTSEAHFSARQLLIQQAIPDSEFVRDLAHNAIEQLTLRPHLNSGALEDTHHNIELEYFFSPEEHAMIISNN
ncbi:MAG TPA: hypothetical protein DCM64_07910 [Gammaproteobacteria bacterium]|jgi:hypothetical protein|nr:hypothetical protein [Gammaproteobacteria bacterium]